MLNICLGNPNTLQVQTVLEKSEVAPIHSQRAAWISGNQNMPRWPHRAYILALVWVVFAVILGSLGIECRLSRDAKAIKRGVENVQHHAQHIEEAAGAADEKRAGDWHKP